LTARVLAQRAGLVAALVVTMVVVSSPPAAAHHCKVDASLVDVGLECVHTGTELRAMRTSSNGFVYDVRNQVCWDDSEALCFNPRSCTGTGGRPGTLYFLWRASAAGGDYEPYGVVCLTAAETDEFEAISWRAIWRRIKDLQWPSAELVIQPPGGRTLINFETNFFTEHTTPEPAVVEIRGYSVTVRAVPQEYVWHWAQPGESEVEEDNESLTTTTRGAEVTFGSDGEANIEIGHVYTDADITVSPSVDVVYGGTVSINGGSPVDIPATETVTVAGTPVPLELVTARVHLVG
jgi:hypothetical protein